MRELHPEPTGEKFRGEFWKRRLEALNAEAPAGDLFGVEDYARALKSARAGKAADRWGCRYEHLKVLAGRADKRPACFLGMHRLAMAVLSGDIPTSLADCIGGARLAALSKPGAEEAGRAAIRPIGVTDIVRRLIARAVTKGTHAAIGDFLSDGDKRAWQLACNIPRGVHKAFVGVTELLRNHPEWLAVTGDVRNAFNSISLEAVAKAIDALEDVRANRLFLSFLVAFYDENGAKHSYFTSDGVRHVVECLTGVTQGCGLGSTMYSIATFLIVKTALAEGRLRCGDVHNIAFADDGTSLGPKNQVIKFAGEIQNRLRDEAGLEFRKWEIYGGVDALDAVKAEGSAASRSTLDWRAHAWRRKDSTWEG